MLAQNLFFYALAAVMTVAAIRVVTSQNIVHAALYLVVVLAGVGGVFILLASEFVAVVQILVYVGAIVVLFLFGIMLTRAPIGRTAKLDNDQRGLSAVVAAFLLVVLGVILVDAFGGQEIEGAAVQQSGDVGLAIFQDYVVPFEVISVLLLAALVGAVVVARRD
ncbi:MAG: NADH-quinone oxidoreductase subunit J family protein [Acidimicrobiales bacterium]